MDVVKLRSNVCKYNVVLKKRLIRNSTSIKKKKTITLLKHFLNLSHVLHLFIIKQLYNFTNKKIRENFCHTHETFELKVDVQQTK